MSKKGVFTITNTITGKVYIGSSNSNLDQRIYDYWQKLHSGTHSNAALQSDFNKYGSSNFSKEIVATCQTETEVRKVTNQMFEKNKNNMYNHHRPTTYDGGNPNASFGESNGKRNNIMEELIDIINKSNLNPYNKQHLKKQVRTGHINSEAELNKKIKALSNNPKKQSNNFSNKITVKASKDTYKKNNKNYGMPNIYFEDEYDDYYFNGYEVIYAPKRSKKRGILGSIIDLFLGSEQDNKNRIRKTENQNNYAKEIRQYYKTNNPPKPPINKKKNETQNNISKKAPKKIELEDNEKEGFERETYEPIGKIREKEKMMGILKKLNKSQRNQILRNHTDLDESEIKYNTNEKIIQYVKLEQLKNGTDIEQKIYKEYYEENFNWQKSKKELIKDNVPKNSLKKNIDKKEKINKDTISNNSLKKNISTKDELLKYLNMFIISENLEKELEEKIKKGIITEKSELRIIIGTKEGIRINKGYAALLNHYE